MEELKLLKEWDKVFSKSEKAHSCYFSRDAYAAMIKNSKYAANKELMLIPNAVHTDLYDRLDIIPFDRIEKFYRENL